MAFRPHHLFAVLPTLAILAGASNAADGVAQDEHMPASQLYTLCSHNAGGGGNPLEAGECLGYVVGIADTFDCVEADHGLHWDPAKAGGSQLALVVGFLQYVNAHPATATEEAHRVVGMALQKEFPCD